MQKYEEKTEEYLCHLFFSYNEDCKHVECFVLKIASHQRDL